MQLFIVSTLEVFSRMQKPWEALAAKQYKSLHSMSQWKVLRAFLQTHPASDWRILILHDNRGVENGEPTHKTRLLGILPIRLVNLKLPDAPRPLKIAVPLAARYSPYTDILIDPAYQIEVWNVFLPLLKDSLQLDGLLLGRFHQSSLTFAFLCSHMNSDERLAKTVNVNYWVNGKYSTLDEYSHARSSKTFKGVKADKQRLANSQCTYTVSKLTEPNAFASGIDFIVETMQSKLRDKLYFEDLPALGDMYKAINHYEAHNQLEPSVMVAELSINNKRQACYLIQSYGYIDAYIIGAYSSEFSKYSPSKLLLKKLVDDAFQSQKVLCFGQGHYDYKADWANQKYDLNAIGCFLTEDAKTYWQPHINGKTLGQLFKVG